MHLVEPSHTTALLAPKCQSFLDNLIAGFSQNGSWNDPRPRSCTIIATGSLLVLFSAFCFAAAVWRDLYPGPPPPEPDTPRIHPWLLVAVNGFLALVAIAALIGIWFGRRGE
jgi:hypothetical protein